MTRKLFLPGARAIAVLSAIGCCSLGYALYIRYFGVEQSGFGLACQAGLDSWFCSVRRLSIALYGHSIFGIVALGVALINLLRPSAPLFALALISACFGVVLYNVALSGLAVAALILSFARPGPAPE
jgi:hypothetical protein